MPAIPVTIKEKEKEKTRRPREPIDARNVGPPKQVKYFIIIITINIVIITIITTNQVKYFCKKCNLDICNACFRFQKF